MSEVDLSCVVWRKSSRSGAGQDCVEVALVEGVQTKAERKADAEHLFLVRDSKDPDGPVLVFTPAEWDAFTGSVKGGEFDDPTCL